MGPVRAPRESPQSSKDPVEHRIAYDSDCDMGVEDQMMPAEHAYPEGGHGWLVVLSTFVVCFWNLGLLVAWGVFKEYLISHQIFPGADIRRLSWIGAIGICLLYLVAPLVALLTRPFGIRPTWCLGVVLSCGGILTSSFVNKVWHLYLTFGILFGAGGGILYFASLVVLSQYFYKHRGVAAGLGGAGAGVGAIVLAPVWRLMLERLGFPWTFRIIAVTMLATLGSVFFFIRPRETRVQHVVDALPTAISMTNLDRVSLSCRSEPATTNTEDDKPLATTLDEPVKPPSHLSSFLSVSPLSSVQKSHLLDDRPLVLLDSMPSTPTPPATALTVPKEEEEGEVAVPPLAHRAATSEAVGAQGSRSWATAWDGSALDLSLLREPRFILLWVISFIFMCGYFIPFFLVPTYATSTGNTSPPKAASLISISTAASLVSRIVLGLTADRLGVFNTSLACFTVSSLSCFALWYPAHDSYALLTIFMLVYGIFAGGLFILLPVAATLIVGQERLPTALGFSFVANAFGGLVGSPIGDAIVTTSGGGGGGGGGEGGGGEAKWVILFTGLMLVASTALCAVLRFAMDRRLLRIV